MTRAERERLIERYLGGAMTSADESNFFIQVALDKELRQDLKAQRTIESALQKDRELVPSEHTALRSRVAASLAASTAPVNTAAPSAQAAANGANVTRALRGRLIGKPFIWALASVAAVVVTVGAMIMMPSGHEAAPSPGGIHTESSPSPANGLEPGSQPGSQPGPGRSVEEGASGESNHAIGSPSKSGAGDLPGTLDPADNSPVSVNSDGARSGSAARVPRRSAHIDLRANDASRPSAMEAARDGAIDRSMKPADARSVDAARPRRSGDSIGVKANILIKPHN